MSFRYAFRCVFGLVGLLLMSGAIGIPAVGQSVAVQSVADRAVAVQPVHHTPVGEPPVDALLVGAPSEELMSESVLPPSGRTYEPISPPWRSRLQPSHALGRAYLATFIPIGLGSLAYTIDESTGQGSLFGSPLSIVGTCLSALGIAIGPSMGLWCTGRSQPAWGSFGVRTAGLGAFGIGLWRASETLDRTEDGFAFIVAAPLTLLVYTLPGILITSAGAGWAFRATPDRFCDGSSGARAHLTPHVDANGGHGLSLTVSW
ncbi:MAG: hypothetical protein PPP56_08715 [Longimonas sp.]|uniref:hypothetical protein n=1 Tax=Longimonas sp. TaxID=2039626 RepID=UPI00334589CB